MIVDLPAALAGLGLGLSLIVAIGAQNAFVLRQGLHGAHVGSVVAVCAASDAALIVAGIAGAGAIVDRVPAALLVVRVGGAAFLLGYALLAAGRALRPTAVLTAGPRPVDRGRWAAVLTALALTWLNPHVYLDTLVLLGSIGAGHGDGRWAFAAGAVAASVVWFTALGFGAALLRPLFARPAAWRVLDGAIAVVMAPLAVVLLLG